MLGPELRDHRWAHSKVKIRLQGWPRSDDSGDIIFIVNEPAFGHENRSWVNAVRSPNYMMRAIRGSCNYSVKRRSALWDGAVDAQSIEMTAVGDPAIAIGTAAPPFQSIGRIRRRPAVHSTCARAVDAYGNCRCPATSHCHSGSVPAEKSYCAYRVH
jgi:hypothetical protein